MLFQGCCLQSKGIRHETTHTHTHTHSHTHTLSLSHSLGCLYCSFTTSLCKQELEQSMRVHNITHQQAKKKDQSKRSQQAGKQGMAAKSRETLHAPFIADKFPLDSPCEQRLGTFRCKHVEATGHAQCVLILCVGNFHTLPKKDGVRVCCVLCVCVCVHPAWLTSNSEQLPERAPTHLFAGMSMKLFNLPSTKKKPL